MLELQSVSDSNTKPRLIEAFDKNKKSAQTNFIEASFDLFSSQRKTVPAFSTRIKLCAN